MVGAKMPQFKVWTKEEEEKVKRQCLCLMDEEGEVDLPLINKAIEAWDEGKRQEYLQTLRYSLDVLRRRAALNGFRAGIIAYLLEPSSLQSGMLNVVCTISCRSMVTRLMHSITPS